MKTFYVTAEIEVLAETELHAKARLQGALMQHFDCFVIGDVEEKPTRGSPL